MNTFSFTNTQLKAGVWEGDLRGHGTSEPDLQITHLGVPLDGVAYTHDPERDVWRVRVPIPASAISDGLQTFVVSERAGTTLTSFAIMAGDPLADDLRAEIALLRGELDMLKKAFRRHCNEG